MNKEKPSRGKRVSNAFGIVSVEGRKPSDIALDVSRQYASGKISAAQAKQFYLEAKKLVP